MLSMLTIRAISQADCDQATFHMDSSPLKSGLEPILGINMMRTPKTSTQTPRETHGESGMNHRKNGYSFLRFTNPCASKATLSVSAVYPMMIITKAKLTPILVETPTVRSPIKGLVSQFHSRSRIAVPPARKEAVEKYYHGDLTTHLPIFGVAQ